jgi:hypothetical protein
MKKAKREELRPEYRRGELGKGIRGKFLKSYQKGSNLVLISPDVAEVFPDEKAVNDALRGLIKIALKTAETKRSSSKGRKRITPRYGLDRNAH